MKTFVRDHRGFTGAEKALLICVGLAIIVLVGALLRSGSQQAAGDARGRLSQGLSAGGSVGAFQVPGALQVVAGAPSGEGDKAFRQIGGAGLKQGDAPPRITVPPDVKKGMDDGWSKSFPGGRSQEQGGILVQKKDGTYEWRPGAAGTSGSFSPNYGDLRPGETLIAVGHTHPYDSTEGNYTNVSFSGQDLARLVFVDDRLAVVKSGEGWFVAARTAEFDALIAGKTDDQKMALFDQMKQDWNDTFNGAKGTFAERADAASAAVAAKYHLVYYTGKDGALTKR